MRTTMLIEITPEELREMIEHSIQKCMLERMPVCESKNDSMLNSDQVEKMLGITRVTLYVWRKKGMIPYHRIGKKIFYKTSEIEKAMDILRKFKARRA